VGRILEPRDVENQGLVAFVVIPTERREVSGASLPERAPVVRGDDHRVGTRSLRERAAPSLQGGDVRTLERDGGPIAAREAGKLVQIEAPSPNDLEWNAAVEKLFSEPAPGSLPEPPRIDGERVERHDEGPEPAERRFRLRVELLGEREVPVEPSGREGLGEEASTLG